MSSTAAALSKNSNAVSTVTLAELDTKVKAIILAAKLGQLAEEARNYSQRKYTTAPTSGEVRLISKERSGQAYQEMQTDSDEIAFVGSLISNITMRVCMLLPQYFSANGFFVDLNIFFILAFRKDLSYPVEFLNTFKTDFLPQIAYLKQSISNANLNDSIKTDSTAFELMCDILKNCDTFDKPSVAHVKPVNYKAFFEACEKIPSSLTRMIDKMKQLVSVPVVYSAQATAAANATVTSTAVASNDVTYNNAATSSNDVTSAITASVKK